MFAIFLTIVLIPAFWFFIIRPQQQRQRAHADLVARLQPGDRIEAFSGIHGTLTAVDETTVEVEIADGVVVTMARLAVATVLDDPPAGRSTPADLTHNPDEDPVADPHASSPEADA